MNTTRSYQNSTSNYRYGSGDALLNYKNYQKNISARKFDQNDSVTNYGSKFDYNTKINRHRSSNYNTLGKSLNAETNINIFGYHRINSTANKLLDNANLGSTINPQERVNILGHEYDENTFKKNLRKPTVSNLIQTTSYNIMSSSPYSVPNPQNTLTTRYNKSFTYNNAKSEKVDDLFYAFNNTSSRIRALPSTSKSYPEKQNPSELASSVADFTGKNTAYYSSVFKSSPMKPTTPKNTNLFTVKEAKSVKEYSYREEQNFRFRSAMEDMVKVVDKFGGEDSRGFFSIYDGHGGGEVSKYAKDRMPDIMEKLMYNTKEKNRDPNYIDSILTSAFFKLDEELKYTNADNVGATATVLFITREKDNTGINNYRQVAYCANVGDSRCVMVSGYGAKRLSYDHKASDPAEMMRVTNSGGMIFGGRVFGQLILTRALGDHALKKHGVVSTPYLSKHFISERDKYIIIASDGVWDAVTDDEMYRLHLQITNSEEYVALIVKTALSRGSQDNISCLVLKLN